MAAPVGNKFALGNSGGRPAHYANADELRECIISYEQWCEENHEKKTVTGLCLYLGFSSRSSLDDYEKRSDEFSYVVKRARLLIENSYELSATTFDMFALKNMGWKDKTEVDTTGSLTIQWAEEKTYEAQPKTD